MKKVKISDEAASLGQLKIKSALKNILKQRNLTYQDVAKAWNCSEPTVKRQLGSEELSLSRLLSLMDWLGLSLTELHKMSESGELESPRLTVRQNEFLAKNPRIFSFLMKLYESGMTPKSIAEKYKMPSSEVDRILIQLEKYDLIRVGNRGQVRPYYARTPNMDGALGVAHMRNVIDRMAQYLKTRIFSALTRPQAGLEKGQLSFAATEMTPKTYQEYLEKFGRLVRDLESAAKIDENLHPKSKLKTCVYVLGFFLDDMNSPDLQLVNDMFAESLKDHG